MSSYCPKLAYLIRFGVTDSPTARTLFLINSQGESLGIEKITGSIAVGKIADIAVLDEKYNVAYTFIDGECVYKKEGGEKA